jgi:MFS family permease
VLAVVYACVIAAALLVATPSVAAPSPGSQPPESDLGAILLDSRDVPPGFELDVNQSRSYEEPPTAPSWLSPIMQHAAHIRGYDRYWYHRPERRAIIAQVIEYPIDSLASASTHSFVQDLKSKETTEFSIPAVPYARGFVLTEGYGGAPAVHGIFIHGSRAFIITVITRGTAPEAEVELTRRLVEIQAGKAPPGPTEIRDLDEAWLAAGTALGTLSAAAAYVGGLSLVAWLRDPLRRHPTGPAPQPMTQPNTTTVDVTTRARRQRRRAAAGLVLELSGAGVAVAGLLPFTWPLGLLLVMLGVGMAWLPRLVTAKVRRAASESELWTGRRRLRVTCYAAMSTVCVISGLLIMVLYGVGAVVTSPGYDYNIRFLVIGAALLAVGTLIRRRARRLAALDADEVLRRDPRPMVLYLRKFADDSLTIRTATYARRSFVDRLSPRRFERFEEVLVRNLTTIGPVVALNPSGTDLAPIGAARETLAADHWQTKIADWMAAAQLIVVGAAPETTSEGFEWELREIDSQELWSKTLLVLPPVPDVTMRARWDRFTKVFTDTAMARHPIPYDPARTLAFLGSPTAGWSAITADQRTEWTYTEALVAATTMATSTLAQQRGG